MGKVIKLLSSLDEDKRGLASRSLGDLVRKLGDRVLPHIFLLLDGGLQSDDDTHRQGVCLGLAEVIACAGKSALLEFVPKIVPAINASLIDSTVMVRTAGAGAFNTLVRTISSSFLLPSFLCLP